jgi:hypothetical protein
VRDHLCAAKLSWIHWHPGFCFYLETYLLKGAKDPAVVKDDLQFRLQVLAKDLNRRIYGERGTPWGTKFVDIEELAVQIGQEISRSMIEQAVGRQADDIPSEAETSSGCGGLVHSIDATELRGVTTRVGTAQWNEPKCYCPKCRAAFCPSVSSTRH